MLKKDDYCRKLFILPATISASFSSGTLSRSTELPATIIHWRARFLNSGLSTQAVGQPQTMIPISQGEECCVVKLYSGGSRFSISRTSFVLSIRGLHPPQYFMPVMIFMLCLVTRIGCCCKSIYRRVHNIAMAISTNFHSRPAWRELN